MNGGWISGGEPVRASKSYQKQLIEDLKDPKDAIGVLNAALEGGDRRVFLVALRNVAEAQGGMTRLARKTNLDRASLYQMFSSKGNPEIESLERILVALGFRLSVVQVKPSRRNTA
jgi:probable addiction module antidote protein